MKTFKHFVFAWVKLTLALPLLAAGILANAYKDGWPS